MEATTAYENFTAASRDALATVFPDDLLAGPPLLQAAHTGHCFVCSAVGELYVVAAPPSQRASLSFSPAAPATPWPRLLLRLNPLSALRRHQLPARALREGLPGQALASAVSSAQVHSQIRAKQSDRRNNILPGLQDVPPVLTRPLLARYSEAPSRFSGPASRLHGWAGYSEHLGDELGLYNTTEVGQPSVHHYIFRCAATLHFIMFFFLVHRQTRPN